MTESIELEIGYTAVNPKTKKEETHKKVTFGKRLTVGDMMNLDEDPLAQNPTRYQDLLRRRMITEFGTLKCPVALDVLLSLDTIDRQDLENAGDEFLRTSRADRTAEFKENHEVELLFGFEINGNHYDTVTFGNRINGHDEIAADSHGAGIRRECFLIGRQISKISNADGTAFLEGKVDLKNFETLDAEDLAFLRVGAALWRESFRQKRNPVSGNTGGDNLPSGEGDGLDGSGNSESADGKTEQLR